MYVKPNYFISEVIFTVENKSTWGRAKQTENLDKVQVK